jgi:DHA1 family multidrug resistance protein-like MFS transporter
MQDILFQWLALLVTRLLHPIFTSYPACFLLPAPGLFCTWVLPRQVVEKNPDIATAAGLINSMIGAAGVAGALLGGTSSQLFGFRETALGAAILAI